MTAKFLSLGNEKYGVEAFTLGGGGKLVTANEILANFSLPVCWAGRHKKMLYNHCINNNLNFYNLDSAYFSNTKLKNYFRVSKNSFQNIQKIENRPADRWNNLGIPIKKITRGSSIVIVPPDRKKLHVEQLAPSVDAWVETIILEIKKHTDRPIRIRSRPANRGDRVTADSFLDFISKDTYCVIGHSSNALIEAAMHDIPVIYLGESAVCSIYSNELAEIEKLMPINEDLKMNWLYHLSYSQFTREELATGKYFDFNSPFLN